MRIQTDDIKKTESKLLTPLLASLRKTLIWAVILKHADWVTAGIPDFSVTGYGLTSWWEMKYADPEFESSGVQELTCLRLGAAGLCRYIIFDEHPIKLTRIVEPQHFKEWRSNGITAPGFDHHFVQQTIQDLHLRFRA